MGFGAESERRTRKLVDEPQDVLDTLQEILDTIEQIRESGKDDDFLDSVEAQACDMTGWIEEKGVATKKQENAAEGWLEAVKKWLPDS